MIENNGNRSAIETFHIFSGAIHKSLSVRNVQVGSFYVKPSYFNTSGRRKFISRRATVHQFETNKVRFRCVKETTWEVQEKEVVQEKFEKRLTTFSVMTRIFSHISCEHLHIRDAVWNKSREKLKLFMTRHCVLQISERRKVVFD